MKKIICYSIIFGIVLLVIGVSIAKDQKSKPEIRKEHMAWVEKCLQDFKFIKTGMSRGEIKNKFPIGGWW